MWKSYGTILGLAGTLGGALSANAEQQAKDWVNLDLETPFKNVYFVPDPNTSEFFAEVVFPYGEAHATGPNGLAHYTEHLVAFSAFPVKSGERFQNDFNASTSFTYTNYYMNSADPNLVLDYLRGVFDPIKLDEDFQESERNVVVREYEVSFSGKPEAESWLLNLQKLYQGSPLSRSIIGTPESIHSLDPKDAIAFHDKYYIPEAATLIVRGNITADEATKMLNGAFAGLETGKPLQPIEVARPDAAVSTLDLTLGKIQRDSTQETALVDVSNLPNWDAISDVANSYISSAKPSALGRKLQYDDNQLSQFQCWSEWNAPTQLLQQACSGEPKRKKELPDLYNEIKDWRAGLSADNEDFKNAVNDIISTKIKSIENLQPEQIYNILEEEVATGKTDIPTRAEYIDMLKSVTTEDILTYYDALLASPTRVTLISRKEK